MTTGKEYNIEQLDDILQLDETQIDDFLLDLKSYFLYRKMFDRATKKLGALIEIPEDSIEVISKGFVWTDDGKRDGRIVLDSIEVKE